MATPAENTLAREIEAELPCWPSGKKEVKSLQFNNSTKKKRKKKRFSSTYKTKKNTKKIEKLQLTYIHL